MSLDRPVALFFFNRPRHLERVFERVRAARPTGLVLVSDGPRPDKPGEEQACADCRSVVERVDWPCEVTRLYAAENMGCRDRIASGLRAVFDRYESAIFLEDDCLPRPSFFAYCDALLDRYAADPEVAFISGTRFIGLPGPQRGESYQFCGMPLVWGWASWRRALAGYDETMPDWQANEQAVREALARSLSALGGPIRSRVIESFVSALNNCYDGSLDTWDQPLAYHLVRGGSKCVVPSTNMIINTGFGPMSTHAGRISSQAALRSDDTAWPLTHPPTTAIDPGFEAGVWKSCFLHPMLGEPMPRRVVHAVKRFFQEQAFKRSGAG